MRFYKLRVTANAASIASTFNEQFKPEIIPEANDPFRVNWINESNEDPVVGEAVSDLSTGDLSTSSHTSKKGPSAIRSSEYGLCN